MLLRRILNWGLGYALILLGILSVFLFGEKTIPAMNEEEFVYKRRCIIIDAGHGGVDGGATSCTGVLESQLNLQIALRLEDLLHLVGLDTVMIRRADVSIYTEGESIAAKKISDLKERVRIVNSTDDAVLISIHQNTFSDPRYSGAQVFYATSEGSQKLARAMQQALVENLNPESNRKAKKGSSIYLLEKIKNTGVLVECGFLSNPEEEKKLRTDAYQLKLCTVIASVVCNDISN